MVTYTKTSPLPTDSLVDLTDPNCIYIGEPSTNGSAENVAVWLIQRIKQVGAIKKIGISSVAGAYNSKWSERATLTYTQGGV